MQNNARIVVAFHLSRATAFRILSRARTLLSNVVATHMYRSPTRIRDKARPRKRETPKLLPTARRGHLARRCVMQIALMREDESRRVNSRR